MSSGLRALIERFLPWYQPAVERQRDKRSERVKRRSETARTRAARVIAEYRRADDAAAQGGRDASQIVTDFRDAQEGAREAGERVIDEVERQ